MMTRKDYVFISAVIKEQVRVADGNVTRRGALFLLTEAFADNLSRQSARFKRRLFMEASGFPEDKT